MGGGGKRNKNRGKKKKREKQEKKEKKQGERLERLSMIYGNHSRAARRFMKIREKTTPSWEGDCLS